MDDWYSEAEFEGAVPLPSTEMASPQAEVHWYDILTSGI